MFAGLVLVGHLGRRDTGGPARLLLMNSGALYPLLTARKIADLKKDSLSKADVVWRAEGVIGTLKVIPRLAGVAAKEIATAVVADDLKACRGQFASGSTKDEKSDHVVRVFTAC